jgi:hypothetical protein
MWSADLGGGSASLTVRDTEADREIGSVFALSGAYVFQPDAALGLYVGGWFGGVRDTSYSFDIFGPSLTWWPGHTGFSLRGVLGFGWLDAGEGDWTEDGVGGLAAAAYEFTITRTVKFGPEVSYGYVTAGSDASADFLSVSFILNWYPGKPPSEAPIDGPSTEDP